MSIDEPLVPYKVPNLSGLKINCPQKPILKSCTTSFITFGSCFARYSAEAFTELGINNYYAEENCFHYTTSSLLQILRYTLSESINEQDYIAWCEDKKSYFSLVHRDLVSSSESSLVEMMRESKRRLCNELQTANVAILTIGTATFQRLIDNDKVICFGNGLAKSRYRLCEESVMDISSNLKTIIELLKNKMAKGAEIVITISPQRYGWSFEKQCKLDSQDFYSDLYSDENWLLHSNLDKAKVRVAIFDLLKTGADTAVCYFPSYDIVIDELRNVETMHHDANDYLHVDLPGTPYYVINRFLNSFASDEFKDYLRFFRKCFHKNSSGILRKFERLPENEKSDFIKSIFEDGLAFASALGAMSALVNLHNLFERESNYSNSNIFQDVVALISSNEGLPIFRQKRALAELSSDCKVALYGLGIRFDELYGCLVSTPIAIFAKESIKYNKVFGVDVLDVSEINNVNFDKIIITSEGSYNAIKRSLVEQGIDASTII